MGKLVMVNASGVTISGSGSWDSTTCPYNIPSELRPPESISTSGMSRDVVLNTLLYVETSGNVSIGNAGGSGAANKARWASLTYIAG